MVAFKSKAGAKTRSAANQPAKQVGFFPVEGKKSRSLLFAWVMQHRGQSLPPSPGQRQHWKRLRGVIASINRWTSRPHEHKREIARRARQAAKRVAR